ncbi:MAG: acyl carrier protein [Anaerolineaceae bacterium]|nr:acyl carrier protein [Anaerolineaceae bacterium]
MKRSEVIPELENLLGLEIGAINEKANIADVPEWDSMAILSFIALVEDKFGLILEGSQIAKVKTFKELLDLIGDKFD